jgi:polyisoprenyl-phosphate glycosyltransferase
MPEDTVSTPSMLSVVVPCFNEATILRETHARLTDALQKTDFGYEIIYVNDGSRDGTPGLLRELAAADEHVRIVSFSRNFGHQVAETAGIDFATGDAVVLIDADLQDPPELIHDMIHLWQAGNQVVYGTRESRRGESAFKLLTAKYFYRMINRISEVEIPLDTGDFRLMDRRVVDVLKNMPERDRFLRGMVSWAGFKQAPLHFARSERKDSGTRFSLRKMLHFAIDGIVSFSMVPLRLATLIGLIATPVAVIGLLYILILFLFTSAAESGTGLILATCTFIGGMILLCLGIMGEYMGRIYRELKRRPLYVVDEVVGFQPSTDQAAGIGAEVSDGRV